MQKNVKWKNIKIHNRIDSIVLITKNSKNLYTKIKGKKEVHQEGG